MAKIGGIVGHENAPRFSILVSSITPNLFWHQIIDIKVGISGIHMSCAQVNAAMKTLIINYGLTLKEGTFLCSENTIKLNAKDPLMVKIHTFFFFWNLPRDKISLQRVGSNV